MGKQKAAPPMRFEPSDFSTDKYRSDMLGRAAGEK